MPSTLQLSIQPPDWGAMLYGTFDFSVSMPQYIKDGLDDIAPVRDFLFDIPGLGWLLKEVWPDGGGKAPCAQPKLYNSLP